MSRPGNALNSVELRMYPINRCLFSVFSLENIGCQALAEETCGQVSVHGPG